MVEILFAQNEEERVISLSKVIELGKILQKVRERGERVEKKKFFFLITSPSLLPEW